MIKVNTKLLFIPIISSVYKIIMYFIKYKNLYRYYISNPIDNRFIINNFLMYTNNSINYFEKFLDYKLSYEELYIKSIQNKEIFSVYYNISNFYIRVYDVEYSKYRTFSIINQKMYNAVIRQEIKNDIMKFISINSVANNLHIKKGVEKWIVTKHISHVIKKEMTFLNQFL